MDVWTLHFTDHQQTTVPVMLYNLTQEEAEAEAKNLLTKHMYTSYVTISSQDGERLAGFRSERNPTNGDLKVIQEF